MFLVIKIKTRNQININAPSKRNVRKRHPVPLSEECQGMGKKTKLTKIKHKNREKAKKFRE